MITCFFKLIIHIDQTYTFSIGDYNSNNLQNDSNNDDYNHPLSYGSFGSGTRFGPGYSNSSNNHLGDTGVNAMVITEDVLHKRDGKVYTSDSALRQIVNAGIPKSVDEQMHEMNLSALQSQREALEAASRRAGLEAKKKAMEAREKREKIMMLQHQKENINKILTSKKEQVVKDIIPTVAVTPHTLGFIEHDKLALKRLNDLREAALQEGEIQKKNALLHEIEEPKSPIEDLKGDPEFIKKFMESAPVNKKTASVDPTKGRFSIINGPKLDALSRKARGSPRSRGNSELGAGHRSKRIPRLRDNLGLGDNYGVGGNYGYGGNSGLGDSYGSNDGLKYY